MTRPSENQKTVEAALDVIDFRMSATHSTHAARAALRDLVAQAEHAIGEVEALVSRVAKLEAALRRIGEGDVPNLPFPNRLDQHHRYEAYARAAADTTEDCPVGGTHAHIRHAKGRCIKCGRVAGDARGLL